MSSPTDSSALPSDRGRAAMPSASALEDFKNQVRIWLELDSSIKLLQQLARERRIYKRQLTDKIIAFMTHHNIEDLTTKEGRLVQRTSHVQRPLSQTTIRQRVEAALTAEIPEDRCTAITTAVFSRDRLTRNALMLRKVKVT